MCLNGSCIPREARCDGVIDCRFGNDEFLCESSTTPLHSSEPLFALEQLCTTGAATTPLHLSLLKYKSALQCFFGVRTSSFTMMSEYDIKGSSCLTRGRKSICQTYRFFFACLEVHTCRPDEWKCLICGECIPRSHRCDSIPECIDRSDEQNCGKSLMAVKESKK